MDAKCSEKVVFNKQAGVAAIATTPVYTSKTMWNETYAIYYSCRLNRSPAII